jgi:putative flippase GtrA
MMSMTNPCQATGLPLPAHVVFMRYVYVAVLSGLCNIAAQQIVLWILPNLRVLISVVAGTAIGFLVKYICDKYWVFLDSYESHAVELRKVVVYGIFGVATTALFWAVELSFWFLFQTAEAKYAGAALGLTLGNVIKYQLDKHYVFTGDRR